MSLPFENQDFDFETIEKFKDQGEGEMEGSKSN
jgi:hypothetical protein